MVKSDRRGLILTKPNQKKTYPTGPDMFPKENGLSSPRHSRKTPNGSVSRLMRRRDTVRHDAGDWA